MATCDNMSFTPAASLLGVPREIRDIIYSHLFAEHKLPVNVGKIDCHCLLPNVCFTNRRMFEEATITFIEKTKFMVRTIQDQERFISFLRSLPRIQGFAAVREFSFPMFHRYRVSEHENVAMNRDIEFMRMFPQLRRVSLTFRPSPVTKLASYGACFSVKPLTKEEICHIYGLQELLECERLEYVEFDCYGSYIFDNLCGGNAFQGLYSLAKMMQGHFKERGRSVKCQVSLLYG